MSESKAYNCDYDIYEDVYYKTKLCGSKKKFYNSKGKKIKSETIPTTIIDQLRSKAEFDAARRKDTTRKMQETIAKLYSAQ